MTIDDLDSEERHKIFADGYKKVESEPRKAREFWIVYGTDERTGWPIIDIRTNDPGDKRWVKCREVLDNE